MSYANSTHINDFLSKYEKTFKLLKVNPHLNNFMFINLIPDFQKINSPSEADDFFEKYGVGNAITQSHYPFERQEAYQLLLHILKEQDGSQFHSIHKGTPYYFIGWTAYQYKDFSKSLFYMDAAVSEDLKFTDVKNKSSTRPSLDFFLLEPLSRGSGLNEQLQLRDIVEENLCNFNIESGKNISIEDFCDKFVKNLLYSGKEGRCILTALYCFFLEYGEKKQQINLRSAEGGSIQPFLDHLFDGARILESLLGIKECKGTTLEPKIKNTPSLAITHSVLKGNKKFAQAEVEYNDLKTSGAPFQDYNFAAAYIIRNTTGHSLLWPDQFDNKNFYSTVYNSIVGSIIWTIKILWL